MAVTTEAFATEGFAQQLQKLASIMASDPDMEERLRSIIREVLKEARSELKGKAGSGLMMKDDPRQAYRAIRSTVYRQVLGGNLNILSRRRAGSPGPEVLKLARVGRGGNRRERSDRTTKLQSYWGVDRGFILRFLNQGADDRHVRFKRGKVRKADRWNTHPNTGNRGSITARHWFGDASQQELEEASERLAGYIEELIAERMGG